MKDLSILQKYFGIADYIAAINGPGCEVIIHDISNLQNSIVHIVNGHITRRKVGGTITDYALDLIVNQQHRERDSVVNYMGTTKDGRILRSSTYFIKDDMQELVGLLCVNIDITDLLIARDILNKTAAFPVDETVEPSASSKEHFALSVDEMVESIIDNAIIESGIRLEDSNAKQKKELTRSLMSRGVFRFKGAVGAVARKLNVSSQSVYRYYKEIEEEEGK
jgi:predicted transcriptional regulator YheO